MTRLVLSVVGASHASLAVVFSVWFLATGYWLPLTLCCTAAFMAWWCLRDDGADE